MIKKNINYINNDNGIAREYTLTLISIKDYKNENKYSVWFENPEHLFTHDDLNLEKLVNIAYKFFNISAPVDYNDYDFDIFIAGFIADSFNIENIAQEMEK